MKFARFRWTATLAPVLAFALGCVSAHAQSASEVLQIDDGGLKPYHLGFLIAGLIGAAAWLSSRRRVSVLELAPQGGMQNASLERHVNPHADYWEQAVPAGFGGASAFTHIDKAHLDDRIDVVVQKSLMASLLVGVVYFRFGGDQDERVLQNVEQTFRGNLRRGDYVARFSDNEFVVFVSMIRNRVDLQNIAERLRQALPKEALEAENISMLDSGVALYPLDGYHASDLVASARESARPQCIEGEICEPQSQSIDLPRLYVKGVVSATLGRAGHYNLHAAAPSKLRARRRREHRRGP